MEWSYYTYSELLPKFAKFLYLWPLLKWSSWKSKHGIQLGKNKTSMLQHKYFKKIPLLPLPSWGLTGLSVLSLDKISFTDTKSWTKRKNENKWTEHRNGEKTWHTIRKNYFLLWIILMTEDCGGLMLLTIYREGWGGAGGLWGHHGNWRGVQVGRSSQRGVLVGCIRFGGMRDWSVEKKEWKERYIRTIIC